MMRREGRRSCPQSFMVAARTHQPQRCYMPRGSWSYWIAGRAGEEAGCSASQLRSSQGVNPVGLQRGTGEPGWHPAPDHLEGKTRSTFQRKGGASSVGSSERNTSSDIFHSARHHEVVPNVQINDFRILHDSSARGQCVTKGGPRYIVSNHHGDSHRVA